MLTPEQLAEIEQRAAICDVDVSALVAEVRRLQTALKDACDQVAQADDREAAATARAHAAEAKVRRVGMTRTWTNEDGKKFAFVEDIAAALADQPTREAADRPSTPSRKNPDGSTTITVQRCCNGCGNPIGDVTEAEIDASVAGLPLPDVRDECPTCTPKAPRPALPEPMNGAQSWRMHAYDDDGTFTNLGDRRYVELHGLDLPIVEVDVRQVDDDDPAATHWGWLDANEDEPEMIWPSLACYQVCFPYGPEAEEKARKGRTVRLAVSRVPAESGVSQ